MQIRKVELMDMLDAREYRAFHQQELLDKYKGTLICFTMNIAGPVKNSDMILCAFEEGKSLIDEQLKMIGAKVVYYDEKCSYVGNEAYYVVDCDSIAVKKMTVEIEENHPLGRLFDIDILRQDLTKVERMEVGSQPRKCLICDCAAAQCASRRIHSLEEIQRVTNEKIQDYFDRKFIEQMAGYVVKGLLYEVSVTPKPGLVDRANNGSHKDMDFYSFLNSTVALYPFFKQMIEIGIQTSKSPADMTLTKLQYIGKCAEQAMLKETGNVNTHKGAIFSMGIICGAIGRLYGNEKEIKAASIFEECSFITKDAMDRYFECDIFNQKTVGAKLYQKYGIKGARGEVSQGFPAVLKTGLPILKSLLEQGYSKDDAGSVVLLNYIISTTDTNMIARSDYDTYKELNNQLAGFLESNQHLSLEQINSIDEDFIKRNLSPGGSADLLAVTWLMYFIEDKTDYFVEKRQL